MSDVKVKIDFEGAAEGAAELRGATEELREMGAAAQASAGQVNALETELGQESAALRALRADLSRATAEKAQLTRASGISAQAATDAGSRFGAMAGAMGNVGAVAGTLSPQMAQMGSVIGQVGSAAGALSGSMGPLGVAIAGVTTVVGLYSVAAQAQQQRMEAQRRAVRRLGRSFQDLAGDVQAAIDRQVDLREVRAGRGTVAQTVGRSRELRNQLETIRRARGGDAEAADALRRQGITGESAGANRGAFRQVAGFLIGDRNAGVGALSRGEHVAVSGFQRRVLAELAQNTEALQVVTERTRRGEPAEPSNRSGGGGGGPSLEDRTFDAQERAAIATQRGIERERQAMAEARIERDRVVHEEAMKNAEEEREAALEAAALREAEYAKEMEQAQRAHDLRMELLDKQKAAQRLAQEESQATAVAAIENVGALGGEVIGVFNEAFQTAIKGQKSFEEAVAEGTIKLLATFGDQLVAMGIGSILEGFTMLVTNPPGAATKIGGGTAMVAFGVGLGAAAAAIPSPGGGGGAPEAPREDAPLAESGGASQINIIFGQGVQTAQTEQGLARQLRRTLQTPALTVGGS